MEQHTECPVQKGLFNDVTALDIGIGIIHGAETMAVPQETNPEIDVPPLPPLAAPPLTSISVANNSITSCNTNNSPLTAPSMNTGTNGTRVTSDTGITTEETPAQPVAVTIQNVVYEYNTNGVALSVPNASAVHVEFNARDSYRDGYDSDGKLGPFFDAVMDEGTDESDDDEELPTASAAPLPREATNTAGEEPQPAPVPLLDEDSVKVMNVAQLKDELRKRKLTVNGVKQVLQERLLSFLRNPNSNNNLPGPGTTAAGQNVTTAGFSEGAAWKELKTEDEIVPEPNTNRNLVGPTVPTGEREFTKRNFTETFDRPPFTAMSPVIDIGRNGKPVKNRRGEVQWTNEIREKGRANKEWVDKQGLTEFSKPSDWFEALLPLKKDKDSPRGMVSISDWTSYLNTRAIISNAGNPSHIYPDFTPFSPQEVKQFIGLYILQGLSPSPQVKQKFKPHHEDYVNGNDLCYQVFGKKGERRHKQFKTFFAIQDPLKLTPPKTTHPNWKVDPFLGWIQNVSMAAWDLGKEISADEQTIGFKGNHQDKQRISYKREGDGFLADAVSEDGYTYTFYFRNMPAPKKYIIQKFSPLHARVLFMFDQFKESHHICGLDNLYNSTKFAREAYVGKNSTMVHGVTRKSGRGLPSCVLQEEIKNVKDAEKVRGQTKAAVLEGDPDCPNLVAFSVYDTKPVHFLSMSCTELKWVEKVKLVFDKTEEKRVQLRFLRCKINDDYNNGMNGVDMADQLRGSYRIDRWMRKRKWWWAIWMWGVQVLLVNAYVLYKTAHLFMWKKNKKSLMSHYEFRRQIALAWLLSDREKIGNNKKRTRTISDMSSSASSTKSRKVCDASLDPNSGSLRMRLDDDQHFPINNTNTKRPCCSLCHWVEQEKDIKNRSGIIACDKCNVFLYISCFKPFHTVSSVSKLRSEVLKNKQVSKE